MAMFEKDSLASQQAVPLKMAPVNKPNLPKKILSALRRNRLRDGRPISSTPITLGRVGSLEIRLAQTEREIRKAQRLRYKVFYKEMDAKPDSHTKFTRRDADAFDAICDHLLVLDHDSPKKKSVAGNHASLALIGFCVRKWPIFTGGSIPRQSLISSRCLTPILMTGFLNWADPVC